jgi:hypothetical protein
MPPVTGVSRIPHHRRHAFPPFERQILRHDQQHPVTANRCGHRKRDDVVTAADVVVDKPQ